MVTSLKIDESARISQILELDSPQYLMIVNMHRHLLTPFVLPGDRTIGSIL